MLDSPRSRLGSLVVLFAVLFASLAWYGTLGPAPSQGSYPSTEHFAPDPSAYVGDRVETAGWVVSTDPVRIEVTDGADRHVEYRVTGLDGPVERGQRLRVYGTLTAPGTIEAENAFAVPRSGLWYAWTVSFLAGLWVLARIVRHWRYDAGSVALAPRDRPLAVGDLVGIGPPGGDRRRAEGTGDRADDGGGGDA